ncbi:riboflavin synthase [Bacillus lacus]|uniref:Riboflavin synthase n=1 Tax=Metabacillus lacus TaxID=1983721 RepID=A0A7X2LYM6_9BACI|nr:riboflavin synthase [Metabacillus lacus]MRX71062.1 riboflavin synthase [Metabacillus lacus]
MFTGIIEEVGRISSIQGNAKEQILTISAHKILEDVHLGDSISVNGVCLTVTGYTDKTFIVDVMPETLKATSLTDAKAGSSVNLERAMAANGRFGGHFVTGHIDGTGRIVSKQQNANAVLFEIEVPDKLTDACILKGSVAVDGISLTIFGLEPGRISISIIPHTLSETVLGVKGKGDLVNIECDMIGKYIQKMMSTDQSSQTKPMITRGFLEEHGY